MYYIISSVCMCACVCIFISMCVCYLYWYNSQSAPRVINRPEKCLYEIEWHHKIACKPHYDKGEAKKCLFNDTTTDTIINLQPLLNFTANTVSLKRIVKL